VRGAAFRDGFELMFCHLPLGAFRHPVLRKSMESVIKNFKEKVVQETNQLYLNYQHTISLASENDIVIKLS
jgi:hypothetical protein